MKSRLPLLFILLALPWMAGGEELDIGQGKHAAMIGMRGRREPMPIKVASLAADLSYPKGQLSLVVDPKDVADGKMAVFLINDTDKPLPRTNFGLEVVPEVKGGALWRRCRALMSGSSVPTMREDLASGWAFVLSAPNPGIGDIDGELRYRLTSYRMAEGVVSGSIPGKFSSTEFEQAGMDSAAYQGVANDIAAGLEGGRWDACQLAKTPEEIAVALELDRTFDESWKSRAVARRWLESLKGKSDLAPDTLQASQRIEEILKADWNRKLDVPALFQRCFEALDSSRSAPVPNDGAPGKHRAVVWRYLVAVGNTSAFSPNGNLYLTVEQAAVKAARGQAGNPFGGTPEQLGTLIKEAENSIRSGNEREADAALSFLCLESLAGAGVTGDRLFELLENGKAATRWPLVRALTERGQRLRALQWLIAHESELGDMAIGFWEATMLPGGTLGEEDLAFFKLTLARNFKGVGLLERRFRWHDGPPTWAGGFREPLCQSLETEAKERRIISSELPVFDIQGRRLPDESLENNGQVMGLGSAITLLGAWKDPADTELLRQFLNHPAAVYLGDEMDKLKRFYLPRNAAVFALKARGEKVRDTVVTEEKLR